MQSLSLPLLLLASLPLITALCFNNEFGISTAVNQEDAESCYVVFDGKKIDAGFLDRSKRELKDAVDCFDIPSAAKGFTCQCSGTICNGRAVTLAREALKLPNSWMGTWKR